MRDERGRRPSTKIEILMIVFMIKTWSMHELRICGRSGYIFDPNRRCMLFIVSTVLVVGAASKRGVLCDHVLQLQCCATTIAH